MSYHSICAYNTIFPNVGDGLVDMEFVGKRAAESEVYIRFVMFYCHHSGCVFYNAGKHAMSVLS